MEILLAVLGGSALAALINQIGEYVRARKKHEETIDQEENADIRALKEAQKYLLFVQIRNLCLEYIAEGEIDFDDRRILNDMHHIYHNDLNGNGDLDILMEQVNHLPLKIYKGATH